ncbi:MAG: MscL family protein [Bacilli bacterium]
MGEKIKKEKKKFTLWADFKKFISRGNVVDMAVGVIMGGAFGAIVTAVVNVLLTVCTWGIPGGISGLVTVLPALNSSQKLPQALSDMGLTEVLSIDKFSTLTPVQATMFTKHGAFYYYNALPIIDWGTLLTVIINFIIIALVLFTILKIVKYLQAKREQLKLMGLEAHYAAHPEDRPAPVVPGVKPITELDVLKEIRDSLKISTLPADKIVEKASSKEK